MLKAPLRVAEGRDSRRGVGVAIAAMTAVVSGFAVFINGYGLRSWASIGDATTYTTVKNLIAAVVLVGLAMRLGRWRPSEAVTRPTSRRQWVGLLAVALIGGSVPFVLFFEGFSRAGYGQAAFIHKTLVVWVVLLAAVFLRERIGWFHVVAVGLLLWGQSVLLGGFGGLGLGVGEVMMLGATLLWSVEVIVAKKLLSELSAMTLGVARMGGGAALLIGYGVVRGAEVDWAAVSAVHVLWVLATGAVLALYVAGWFAALARAQAVDVTAILVGGALITGLLNVGIRSLAVPPVAGLALVGCGAGLALWAGSRRPESVRLP